MPMIRDLPLHTQNEIVNTITRIFGVCNLDENDNFYGISHRDHEQFGMQYGYVTINGGQVWICDSTPDHGDVIVSVIDF